MRFYEPDQRTPEAKILNHIEAGLVVATRRRRRPGSVCGDGPGYLDYQEACSYSERYPQRDAALA